MRRWCTALATSLLAAACAAHAAPPERVVIDYEVRYNDSAMATAKHVLEHDAKTYRLIETWEGSGLLSLLGEIRRTSEGRVTREGLRPLAYEAETDLWQRATKVAQGRKQREIDPMVAAIREAMAQIDDPRISWQISEFSDDILTDANQ